MRVDITISGADVLEAINDWLSAKGVPVVASKGLRLERQQNASWFQADPSTFRCRVAMDVESYSSSEARRVEPEPPALDPKVLDVRSVP